MKKLGLFGLLCFMVAITMFGCSSTPTGTTGKITGSIYAADGATPIANATVYLKTDSSKTTTTNASGYFELSGTWIIAGTFTLVAEKGAFKLEFTSTVTAEGSNTSVGTKEVDPADPSATVPDLGVVVGSFDTIQDIIHSLGYKYVTIEAADLLNYAYISTFEAIFLNCDSDSGYIVDDASKEANVKNFVESVGGSLYASDYAADVIEAIWPSAVTWYGGSVTNAKKGTQGQTITAEVVDADLQVVLGKNTASIYYNLPYWVVISAEGTGTTVLLKGAPTVSSVYSLGAQGRTASISDVSASSTTISSKPLAVKFTPVAAKGTVIYTTFHNEANVSNDVVKILKDFIFSL